MSRRVVRTDADRKQRRKKRHTEAGRAAQRARRRHRRKVARGLVHEERVQFGAMRFSPLLAAIADRTPKPPKPQTPRTPGTKAVRWRPSKEAKR